jgi:hypothetical protein
MGYWRYEIRLYKQAWRKTWPEGALSKGVNVLGPLLLTILVAGFDKGASSALELAQAGLYGLVVSVTWNAIRFWRHLIAAPSQLDRELSDSLHRTQADLTAARAQSPLKLNFDALDTTGRYFRDRKNEHGDGFRRFYVGIENIGARSIDNVVLRVLPGDFAGLTVYVAYDPIEHESRQLALKIKELPTLHPGEEQIVELFGLEHGIDMFDGFNGDLLVLEAAGRDVQSIRLSLKFTNGMPPSLGAIL